MLYFVLVKKYTNAKINALAITYITSNYINQENENPRKELFNYVLNTTNNRNNHRKTTTLVRDRD